MTISCFSFKLRGELGSDFSLLVPYVDLLFNLEGSVLNFEDQVFQLLNCRSFFSYFLRGLRRSGAKRCIGIKFLSLLSKTDKFIVRLRSFLDSSLEFSILIGGDLNIPDYLALFSNFYLKFLLLRNSIPSLIRASPSTLNCFVNSKDQSKNC